MDAPQPPRPDEPIAVPALLERCMGRADLAGLLLAKLERQAAADLEALAGLLAAGDLTAGGARSHALKGAAAALAAGGVRAGAARLEQACRAAARDEAAAALSALTLDVQRLLADLPRVRSILDAHKGAPA